METERIIVKEDGTRELFNEEKIRKSLINAGAAPEIADKTVSNIEKNLKEFTSSKSIYELAIGNLKREQPAAAIKYTLKKAMLELGPTGFIFERYFAKVLAAHDFKTEVGIFVNGYCVEHEVDIIAEKSNSHIMIECKYHNDPGSKSDIKVALYVHARFEDIKRACETGKACYNFAEGWLATNTKCSSEAIKYASCVNLGIVAWHYPFKKNLEYYIESKKLYPVSILPGLNEFQKIHLFDKGVYTIGDLLGHTPDAVADYIDTTAIASRRLFSDAAMLFS